MYYKLFMLVVAVASSAVVVPFLLPDSNKDDLLSEQIKQESEALSNSLNLPESQAIESAVSERLQRKANAKSSETSGAGLDKIDQAARESIVHNSINHNQEAQAEPKTEPMENTNNTTEADLLPYEIELPEGDLEAMIQTSLGLIRVKLYREDAPKTVANFYELSRQGFYEGVTWHRVIEDFMIQGGDPLSKDDDPTNDGTGGPGYQFEDEINEHKLVRGSLAMANSGPGTNGSQFFIVTASSTPHLDGKHTNFGEVTEGMEIVDMISKVEKDERDRPLENVTINSIEVIAKHSSSQTEEPETEPEVLGPDLMPEESENSEADTLDQDSELEVAETPEEDADPGINETPEEEGEWQLE